MKAIDLTKALKPYSEGWVAVSKKSNKVIAHAKTFVAISKKIEEADDIILIPASKSYFGFITASINA